MARTTEARGRASVREFLAGLLDPGTFVPWDGPSAGDPPHGAGPESAPEYAAELERAHRTSGADEAVVCGEGRVRGLRVAVAASEFSFLGGSIGAAAAERLTRAAERATDEGLPLIAAPASGGTRMQEGTRAFLAMAKVSAAIAEHKSAGLPYLVYLRHPTTGGVLASWGSQGHVTLAEPRALIGFLGPRAQDAILGHRLPEGVQSAENLYRHGLVDAVVAPEALGEEAHRLLTLMSAGGGAVPAPLAEAVDEQAGPAPAGEAWDSVTRTRRAGRPGLVGLLRHAAEEAVLLHGTGDGRADPAMTAAFARFGGTACVLVGQDRAAQNGGSALGAGALRTARRGIRLAAELRLPLVTVIDTPGAALSAHAEEEGIAGEIARCLADLATLPQPTVSVLLGQGAGGAALALLPADRVLAARHAWLSPLPFEGASGIVHRTPDRAAEVAAGMGARSADLREAGAVDLIVDERGDAADEPEAFCRRMGAAIGHGLGSVAAEEAGVRLARRRARFWNLGTA
ncbi:acetyl-CoA carboxyl transferase [Nocardiopsis sp. LSu2-4]|uniref:Acetyl-CoA carboxyl transferase n=1 Tax=Nocardiopsis suaedae TaxID=3018444 RepID=A0ABT4TN18_9ACTN|nr:carboxyl transferase domain-containing protein [Nocardiopsis suaedae]MDA2806079.1 acetyl-CoA carboxyl transferase [Nocardiopsis suaedae]